MKIFYTFIGFIALGLGGIGAFLPVLPTTPFLIVAAFCFAKSSKRLNSWFKSTKLYKDNLESFINKEGMPFMAKLRILTMVTLLLGVAAFFMQESLLGLYVLALVWIVHMLGIGLCVKTKNE